MMRLIVVFVAVLQGERVNIHNRRRFAAEMSAQCRTEVEPVRRPEMAAEDKDIIITATNSREPVLNGNWVAEGTHLNVIGSNFLGKAEIDAVTVRCCDSIVVDSKDQARLEAGDFSQALEEGSIHWSNVHELGQVIVGSPDTVFAQVRRIHDELGAGIIDLVVGAQLGERTLRSIELFGTKVLPRMREL